MGSKRSRYFVAITLPLVAQLALAAPASADPDYYYRWDDLGDAACLINDAGAVQLATGVRQLVYNHPDGAVLVSEDFENGRLLSRSSATISEARTGVAQFSPVESVRLTNAVNYTREFRYTLIIGGMPLYQSSAIIACTADGTADVRSL